MARRSPPRHVPGGKAAKLGVRLHHLGAGLPPLWGVEPPRPAEEESDGASARTQLEEIGATCSLAARSRRAVAIAGKCFSPLPASHLPSSPRSPSGRWSALPSRTRRRGFRPRPGRLPDPLRGALRGGPGVLRPRLAPRDSPRRRPGRPSRRLRPLRGRISRELRRPGPPGRHRTGRPPARKAPGRRSAADRPLVRRHPGRTPRGAGSARARRRPPGIPDPPRAPASRRPGGGNPGTRDDRLICLAFLSPLAKAAAIAVVLVGLDVGSPLDALAVVPALELAALIPLTPGNVGVAALPERSTRRACRCRPQFRPASSCTPSRPPRD